jgi:hypothetical protein
LDRERANPKRQGSFHNFVRSIRRAVVSEGHVSALRSQTVNHRNADTPASAGDESNLPFEFFHFGMERNAFQALSS